MIPTLTKLPPWTVAYSYEVTPNQSRSEGTGYKRQTGRSNRKVTVASVTRVLQGVELQYLIGFLRGECNGCQSKFRDVYADGDELQTGIVRIKDGAYSVKTNLHTHTFSCELEIFR